MNNREEIGYAVVAESKEYKMPKNHGCPLCGQKCDQIDVNTWICRSCEKIIGLEEMAIRSVQIE